MKTSTTYLTNNSAISVVVIVADERFDVKIAQINIMNDEGWSEPFFFNCRPENDILPENISNTLQRQDYITCQ